MLSILIDLQRLKNLDRTGWTLRGLAPRTESVAAHSFGVAVTAIMLADELVARGVEVDRERLLRMALLHDWAETRIGDLPKTATEYFGSDARRRAETAAFADILRNAGAMEAHYRELHEEYESRTTIEARLVKAADVIDLLIQTRALERAGAAGLDEFWDIAQEREWQLEGAAREVIGDLLHKLLTARAQLQARK